MSELRIEHIMQVGLGFWPSKTLLSAVELEVFTFLANNPADLPTLSEALGVHSRSARDFFDALVALGFLERSDGTYRNTPSTDFFLDKRKLSYIGGMLEMANLRLYPYWAHLTTALRTGEQQNELKGGGNPFTKLYADTESLTGFLRAMTGISNPANRAIAERFPWKDYSTAGDFGTAQGDLIVQVVRANPHISGTGIDLPEVASVFEAYVAANEVSSRVRFQPGNFFHDKWPQVDVVMMGHILHDWDLQQKKFLIGKAFETLPKGGALIVYESIIDDDRSKNAFGLLMSLNMLVETPGGFDYTGADCMGWMKQAGFRETRVEHLVGPDSMVVGIK